MRMSVCEIGMPRTGTRSLAKAMKILGYKSKHGIAGLTQARTKDVAWKFTQGRTDLVLYNEYDFVGNLPHYHWEQLLSTYTNVKFILTMRNERDWWAGVERRWTRLRKRKSNLYVDNGILHNSDLIAFMISVRLFGCFRLQEKLWKDAFRTHNNLVRDWSERRDILVLDICRGQGWEELCPFLGVPVPDVPFPNTTRPV